MNRTLLVLAVGSIMSLSVDTVVSQTPPGVVSHVSVVSDKTPDVSSMEAWKRAFIREGMSDCEKGLAVANRDDEELAEMLGRQLVHCDLPVAPSRLASSL